MYIATNMIGLTRKTVRKEPQVAIKVKQRKRLFSHSNQQNITIKLSEQVQVNFSLQKQLKFTH